jgi:putative membrane protein
VRRRWLLAGAAVTSGALAPPVDTVAHRSLAIHMAQHVALVLVAAPLLGAALPRRRRGGLPAVVGALVLQTTVVIGWHTPALYDAAVRNDALHALEHASFVAAATVFWWTLVSPPRGEHVVAAFIAGLPMAVLGLGLTLASTPWYAAYRGPIAEQQVAGAVMWGVGGMLTVASGAALFYAWLSRAARSEQSFDAKAATAKGSTTSAARNVHVTGAIETPSFWA